MNEDKVTLDSIQTKAWALSVLLLSAAIVAKNGTLFLGALLGVGLCLGNFIFLRQALGGLSEGKKIQEAYRLGKKYPKRMRRKMVGFYLLKIFGIYGLIVVLLATVEFDYIGFLFGLSVIVGAILLEAAYLVGESWRKKET